MIVDSLLIGVLALGIAFGYKRGAILTLARLFGAIGAFFAAKSLAPACTYALLKMPIGQNILQAITKRVVAMLPMLARDAKSTISSVLIPKSWRESAAAAIGKPNESMNLASTLAVQIFTLLVMAFIMIGLLVLVMVVVRIVTKTLDYVPLLGLVNRLLGAASGLIGGIIVAFVVAIVLVSLSPMVTVIAQVTQTSYIVKWLMGLTF